MLIFNEIIKKPIKSFLNFLSYVENLKIAFDMFKTNQYQKRGIGFLNPLKRRFFSLSFCPFCSENKVILKIL